MKTLHPRTKLTSLFAATGLALAPIAFAVDPPPDGGYPNENTAEGENALFSFNTPTSGLFWRLTGKPRTQRYFHTATLLPNGMVLVAGGIDISASASAELYDPASGTWTITGSLNTGRVYHTATLLPNGMVLVAGGIDSRTYSASAELYDPASGTWTTTGSLNTARSAHSDLAA